MKIVIVTDSKRDYTAKALMGQGAAFMIQESPPAGPNRTPERSCTLGHQHAIHTASVRDPGAVVLEDDLIVSEDWQARLQEYLMPDPKGYAVALYVPDFCRARCRCVKGTQLEQYDHTRLVGTQAIWWGCDLAAKVSLWLALYDDGGGRLPIDDALRLCPHLAGRFYATPVDLFDHKPGPSGIPSSKPHKAGRFTKGVPCGTSKS
jgi:hypothetical protein